MNRLIHNGNARMAWHHFERAMAGLEDITPEDGMAALRFWIQDAMARQVAQEREIIEETEANG